MVTLAARNSEKARVADNFCCFGVDAACPHEGHNLGSRRFGIGTQMLSSWEKMERPKVFQGHQRGRTDTKTDPKGPKGSPRGPTSRILEFLPPAGLRDRLRVRFVQFTFKLVCGVRLSEAAIFNEKTKNKHKTNKPTSSICSPAGPTFHPSCCPDQLGP